MLCTYTSVLCFADEIPLSRPKKRKPKGKTPLGKVLPRLEAVFVIVGETCAVAKLLTDTQFSVLYSIFEYCSQLIYYTCFCIE